MAAPGWARFAWRWCSAAATLTALLLLQLSCAGDGTRQAGPQTYVFRGTTMGTYYEVKVVALDLTAVEQARIQDAIEGELTAVDGAMSTYRADSELSRFNRYRETAPFPLSATTLEVLATALTVHELTAGAFDVTVGPLVNLWGFGPEGVPAQVPGEAEIARVRQRVGSERLILDRQAGTVRKEPADVYCDLSALAKGHGVDRVATVLAADGLEHFLVEVGGEVRAAGHNADGVAWRIGIERPVAGVGGVERIVPLSGLSMATSGDYRNLRIEDGARISHIIDPRNGRPITHWLTSVSVVHPSCMMADSLATAFMVLGPEAGRELATQQDLPVLFLIRQPAGGYLEQMSPAFARLVAPPAGESGD